MNYVSSIFFDGLFAAAASAGFAVILNPPRKAIFISAFLAASGHSLRYFLMNSTPLDITCATFISAFAIGMGSMLCAKLVHLPAEIFSFPSLLPMVPGMYAYKTILSLISFMKSNDETLLLHMITEIFQNGLTTIGIMTSLVVGAAIPLFMFYEQSFRMTRRKKTMSKPHPKQ